MATKRGKVMPSGWLKPESDEEVIFLQDDSGKPIFGTDIGVLSAGERKIKDGLSSEFEQMHKQKLKALERAEAKKKAEMDKAQKEREEATAWGTW